jgi:hypothetical protein
MHIRLGSDVEPNTGLIYHLLHFGRDDGPRASTLSDGLCGGPGPFTIHRPPSSSSSSPPPPRARLEVDGGPRRNYSAAAGGWSWNPIRPSSIYLLSTELSSSDPLSTREVKGRDSPPASPAGLTTAPYQATGHK